MPGSRAAGLGQDHQRFLQDHDERARARPADQAARDAAIMDSYPRSDLRVLVRLFPGHDGQSNDRVLQQPRDRPARDLPADFRRGYRGPKIVCSIEMPADTAPCDAQVNAQAIAWKRLNYQPESMRIGVSWKVRN